MSEVPAKKIIAVAAAVILDETNQVFLAKRSSGQHQGDLWEFPGGKIEAGESATSALIREINEEIGIAINAPQAFITVPFDYTDKSVVLEFFIVRDFEGEPWGKEGQETAWYTLSQLSALAFPEANKIVVEKLLGEYLL